jgi:hypothetical protein
MTAWTGVACTLLGGLIWLLVTKRALRYRCLTNKLAKIEPLGRDFQPPTSPIAGFEKRIISISHFLPADQFEEICREVTNLTGIERSFVPTHKKGGTIAYETIINHGPIIAALYHAPALRSFVSRIVGVRIAPTPLHDQSSLSILVYDRPGDHIGWHFDHNFYRGRHFTVLLTTVNSGQSIDGLSHARLIARIDDTDTEIATPPNTLVLFEGARVRHKVTPTIEGERRVLISMTYCADPRESLSSAVARRIKDTAFFGLRALWT